MTVEERLAMLEREQDRADEPELIRALVDQASARVDPAGKDFEKAIRAGTPDILKGI